MLHALTAALFANPAIVLVLSPLVGLVLSRLFRGLVSISPPHQYGLIFGSLIVAGWAILYSSQALMITLVLGWILLLLAMTDIAIFRLPNILTLPLLAMGLAVTVLQRQNLVDHGLTACGAFALFWGLDRFYRSLRGRSGLGLGDAKLFAAAGAWLGWRPLPTVLLLACAGGLIWTAVRVLQSGQSAARKPLPFGAPLCASLWIVWCNFYS